MSLCANLARGESNSASTQTTPSVTSWRLALGALKGMLSAIHLILSTASKDSAIYGFQFSNKFTNQPRMKRRGPNVKGKKLSYLCLARYIGAMIRDSERKAESFHWDSFYFLHAEHCPHSNCSLKAVKQMVCGHKRGAKKTNNVLCK
jgi:hypothetical protein